MGGFGKKIASDFSTRTNSPYTTLVSMGKLVMKFQPTMRFLGTNCIVSLRATCKEEGAGRTKDCGAWVGLEERRLKEWPM